MAVKTQDELVADGQMKPFKPAKSAEPDMRQAHALEYIAAQLGMIRMLMQPPEPADRKAADHSPKN